MCVIVKIYVSKLGKKYFENGNVECLWVCL